MFTKTQQSDWEELARETREIANGKRKAPNREKWERQVTIEVPLGEFINSAGLMFYSATRGGKLGMITGEEGFNAQGLEGKASIAVQYAEALIQASGLKPYRFRILDGRKLDSSRDGDMSTSTTERRI